MPRRPAPPPADPLVRATARHFLYDPVGRFAAGPSYLVWCRDASLCGATYWGKPKVSRELFDLLAVDRHRTMHRPIDVLTDTRKVTSVEEVSLRRLVSYVRGRLPELARNVRRHAVVHDGSDSVTVHAIVGVYAKMQPRFAVKTFERMPEALKWLGRPASLAIELEALGKDVATEPADLLGRLRELLERERRGFGREEAAEMLGVPVSLLRSTLDQAGTSCMAELETLRIEWAKRELLETDEPLDRVAEKAGYGSRVQLFRAFRDATGVAPGEYRTQVQKRTEKPKVKQK